MAALGEAIKIISVPAIIAASIYVLTVYVMLPLIRQHRDRYDQYVPVDTILHTTAAVRSKVTTLLMNFFVYVVFRRRHRPVESAAERRSRDSQDSEDLALAEEDGETMVGFDLSYRDRALRGGHDGSGGVSGVSGVNGVGGVGGVGLHSDSRLSRDIEEGFRDDSEDD